ncbi:aldo/keto reductase [Insolitispirillum peregrinum]|uniref:aldo/keto reductase n=1 Tax=Insolitispirillum peregrinum TaxID=80876 RepID=UPI00360D359C
MRYHLLGQRCAAAPLKVSSISMGTMTFGEQNTPEQAHELLDIAYDGGVNFFDVAEMYPISPRPETQGRSEEILGDWVRARNNRHQVVIASKVTGRGVMPWIRGEERVLDRRNIAEAIDGSLRRLKTDYLDLYYLHWPDRQTNNFGRLGYVHNPEEQSTPLAESLLALADLVKAGKIRHVGISNETPWGLAQYLLLAAQNPELPRVAAIQNPYSLINRTFEIGLAEMAIREDVPLVAYSPLAGGVLTGKYMDGERPADSRMVLWPKRYTRYTKPLAQVAVERYTLIAERHGLHPAQMALAFAASRSFAASAIVGATRPEQLKLTLAAQDLVLGGDALMDIEAEHTLCPNPAP